MSEEKTTDGVSAERRVGGVGGEERLEKEKGEKEKGSADVIIKPFTEALEILTIPKRQTVNDISILF